MPPPETAPKEKKRSDADARPAPVPSPALTPDTASTTEPTATPPGAASSPDTAAPAPGTGAALEEELRRKLAGFDALQAELRGKLRELDEKLGLAPEAVTPKADSPGKLLGHVPVYANDNPEDVLERAREMRRGNIPVHMAKRFRTTARINAITTGENPWPLAKRIKEPALPLGFEFGADEMPMEERAAFFEAGAIEAIE